MSATLEKNGTWTSQFRYEDIYGATRHKCKRGWSVNAFLDKFYKDKPASRNSTGLI